jgi:hypothetical protein
MMKTIDRALFALIISAAALYCGYCLLDKWAVDEFGIVRVWAFKRTLFSVKTLYYIGFAISALLAIYIATKINSVKMLAAVLGIIAAVPFCVWLYNYLGSRYFNIVGKTFFYTATTGVSGWLLFSILSAPLGLLKRFAEASKGNLAKRRIDEAKAMSILADAKGRYRQSQYITVAGRSALAIDTETGKQKWYAMPTKAELAQETVENPWADMDAVQIFEQIYQATARKQNCPSLIIAGKKRSGKSYFASWLTREYADEIDFVVYDPKQFDPLVNWGHSTRVVGNDSDYEAIARDLRQQEKNFKSLYPGHPGRKKILLFDEWLSLVGIKTGKKPLHEHGEYIFNTVNKILTEMSYLGVGVIVMPHATSCTALRLPPGYGELKNNYDGIFRFHGNLLTGSRKSYFEVDQEEFEIKLWNPDTASRGASPCHRHQNNTQKGRESAYFGDGDTVTMGLIGPTTAPCVEPEIASEQPVRRFYDYKYEKIICESYGTVTKSLSALAELAGWPKNGRNTAKVKAVLDKYSIVTDS